ncbi:MAG TPA: GtrA family protein [Streptosporangiaceae bacterium]|nr:GtrA family protein [Streptosporangiaceae bacterium]
MTVARRLIARFRHLFHEVAKFGAVGLAGFIVTELGFNLLHFDAGLGLFTSNALATAVAAVLTFTGNKYWTFRHRAGYGTAREAVAFFALNAVGALIQYACVWIARYAFGATDKIMLNVAFFLGIMLATVFRFWTYRTWVWHANLAEPPIDSSEPADLVHPR